ncbi:TPA: type II toxin-antitoxin system HicB family antitoxin [Pseudomonas aeruginosa]|nr:type II toxin-antitoxin system HicB family antitoxin [Pseudomonas aeruginosa]
MYNFAIRFEQDDSAPGVAVFCRDLPELNSYGDTVEHALSEAVDAIETTLSLYVDQRRSIPVASAPEPEEHVVHLPAVTVAKIALWNEMMRRGMRKADLCRVLGITQVQGDRLVDFLHTSKMEQVESALAALEMRLVICAEPVKQPKQCKGAGCIRDRRLVKARRLLRAQLLELTESSGAFTRAPKIKKPGI